MPFIAICARLTVVAPQTLRVLDGKQAPIVDGVMV